MSVPNAHFTTLQGAYDVDMMEVTLRVRRYAGQGSRPETKSYTVEVPTSIPLKVLHERGQGATARRVQSRSAGTRMDRP